LSEVLTCLPRSPVALYDCIASFKVETAEKYRKRDVTGDGLPETFCNVFLADVTAALSAPVPLFLANAQVAWLKEMGKAKGWSMVDAHKAEVLVNEGYPVVAGWSNPRGHGHVAIGCPSNEPGMHVAQAGSSNFTCRPIERGFGHTPFLLFAHD
jgi:hypothetical protein